MADDTTKMQAEPQATKIQSMQELKRTQEDIKRQIAEGKAQLTNASTPIIAFDATIWNKKAELASEGQASYEVILNGLFNKSIVADCNGAKRLSYYMLETFYRDDEIRPTLSRVMITTPYYLRVSLGGTDGVPMEQNGGFSGPTNFWTVMEKWG